MKLKYFIIVTIIFLGCKPIQTLELIEQSPIVYVFPKQVENALKDNLSTLKNTENTVLDLKRFDDYFVVYVSSPDVFWKESTNRRVLVGTEFYPLILDLDYVFATTESSKEVLERLKPESKENYILRKQITHLYHNIFKIKFTRKGEILYQGYDD